MIQATPSSVAYQDYKIKVAISFVLVVAISFFIIGLLAHLNINTLKTMGSSGAIVFMIVGGSIFLITLIASILAYKVQQNNAERAEFYYQRTIDFKEMGIIYNLKANEYWCGSINESSNETLPDFKKICCYVHGGVLTKRWWREGSGWDKEAEHVMADSRNHFTGKSELLRREQYKLDSVLIN